MYVVTFYSFKGGVGRSMALVNIGVQLAQSGKKVLLVDFDLEAPGLPTFSLRKPDKDVLGIVEYVSKYIATGESPDVKDYVYRSEEFASGGSLCVMPVGKQDSSYSSRLNSIDWGKLYAEQAGFLLLEDLKRQWAEQIAPDYVLIDSRTGHSDVEGICTRQLPDAVCLLFFPNEQNLQGLKRIVSNIKADNEISTKKVITTHFVVSNVPDLDDEDEILGKTLEKFKKELGYKELAAEIHHYNSLSLLNQEIFSLDRPNSRLTKEYNILTTAITMRNLRDRDAVIAFLKSANRDLKDVMDDSGPTVLEDKLQRILENFTLDGEIRFRVSLIYEQLGNSEDALSMLSDEIFEQHYPTAPMYATRARLNQRSRRPAAALRDVHAMLNADGADLQSFLKIVPIMDQLDQGLFAAFPDSRAFQSLSKKDQAFLAYQLKGNEDQLKASITILRRLGNSGIDEDALPLDDLNNELALASIGIGDFKSAVELLEPVDGEEGSLRISDAFNLAMAKWGRDKVPPLGLFEIVIKKNAELKHAPGTSGPNYLQCMAISFASLRNVIDAKSYLEEAKSKIGMERVRVFSAWSYSKVTPRVFLDHLAEIEKFIEGADVLPTFIINNDSEHIFG